MSGLTCFFRDYVVLVNDNENTSTTANNINTYHQSLINCTVRKDGVDDDNKDDSQQRRQQQQLPSSRSGSNPNNLVQTIHEPLDYKKCKVWRCQFLQAFLDNRMTRNNDNNSNNNDDDETEEDDDDDTYEPQQQAGEPTTPQQWETQFETQQDLLPQQQQQQHTTPRRQQQQQPMVASLPLTPHIEDTLHHIDYIQDLDLMTRTATLLICPCEKLFARRFIHRTKQAVWPRTTSSHATNKLYCSAEQMPWLSMDACQEDGPLSSCYATVCSVQVLQHNVSDLRQRAEQAAGAGRSTTVAAAVATGNHHAATTSRRLLFLNVYLYNQYAAVLEKLQQNYATAAAAAAGNNSKHKKYQLVFSFHQIPAKCIFPCPARDWYERMHLSECCLCIGDESILSIREEPSSPNDSDDSVEEAQEEEEAVPVRFDDKDMRIYVGFVNLQEGSLQEEDVYCLIPHETAGVMVKRVRDGHNDISNPFVGYPEKKKKKQQQQQQQQPSTETTAHFESVRGELPAAAAPAAVPNAPPSQQQEDAAPTAPQAQVEEPQPTRKRQRPAEEEKESREETAAAAAAQRPRNEQPGRAAAPSQARDERQQQQQQQQQRTAPPPPQPSGQRPQQQQQQQEVHYETFDALQEVLAQHQALAQADPNSSGPCIINLHGVVIGFSPPTKTRRGDYMMGIALVDQTVPLAADEGSVVEKVHTVNINIFTKNKESLPKILYAGDVLRMHRVKLQQWKDDLQLMGMRASSYVVFRGNVQDPAATTEWTVLPTCQTSQVTQVEHERMQTLWTWGQKRLLTHPTMKQENSFRLGDVMHQESNMMGSETGLGGDITVMVSAILPIPEHQLTGVSPRGFLRVWDGTGTPDSDPYPLPGVMVDANDPPSSALVQLAALIKKLQFIRQNPDLQPPKVVAGRVVNVAIWEKAHWELVNQAVTVGSFVRLRNVRDDRLPNSGLHSLMVLPKSYLTPLPNLCYEVVQLLEDHNSRLLRKEPENPQSGILPLNYEEQGEEGAMDTSEPAVPGTRLSPRLLQIARTFQKLSDLLPAPVNSLFEGTIRVIAVIPSMSSIASGGLEQICTIKDNEQVHSFCFGVRIRDVTGGEIDAIVMDESIGQELVGMPAEEALRNSLGALFNLHRMIQEQEARQATIKSIAHLGTKYFVVERLQSN